MSANAEGETMVHLEEQLSLAKARIAELERERDEADRAAGEALRKLQAAEENIRKTAAWLAEAKRIAGYPDETSFDVVWECCLAAYKETQKANPA